jgi:drug/metabolite transporter (DMT)-like permease
MNGKVFTITLVIFSAFFWGSNFNAAAIVVKDIQPLFAAIERFTIATLFIFIFLFLKQRPNFLAIKNDILPITALGLIGITGLNVTFFIGIKSTSPMNGALIMAMSPITTALLAAIIDKHKITYLKLLGMIISFIGVALVISDGNILKLLRLQLRSGDLLIICSNLSMAIYTIGCRKFIKHSTPLQVSSFTMLVGTIGIVLFALFYPTSHQRISDISYENHLLLAYMGIAGSVLAYLFWNIGIRRLGAPNTSIFFNFVPIFTMLISIFQGITPNKIQFIGTILVILGVLVTTKSAQTKNQTQPILEK